MTEYHFMADVLTTFRSCPDAIKALIVGGFYAAITVCVLGSQYLWLLRHRESGREIQADTENTAATGGVIDLSGKRQARDG